MPTRRFPNYPKYIGRPTIALSPNNSEISVGEAIQDQTYLGYNAPKKRLKRRGKEVLYCSKVALRPDRAWEARVWNYLNAPGCFQSWVREVDRRSGQRVFLSERLKVRIVCGDQPSANLSWSNGGDGWREVRVTSLQAGTSALPILGGLLEDLCKQGGGA